ncbi:hypothetical protein MF672_006665 [Actinomadura sp. ATCC 31491]|uniref:DUF2568 domain-containing protein n=1 Tax=Actinomadura luzonensis TaxID=2805427 RepID=A0ABT0FMA7_9ACTN|nr:hypothetical protein [Actinomadura luzonensis]MCK2213476.1 hypothetical protein [Actinomadura luzonensis]
MRNGNEHAESALRLGRWRGGVPALLGVVSIAWVVLLETAWAEHAVAPGLTGSFGLVALLAAWWGMRRPVTPATALRRLVTAAILWYALYLLVVGPLARWHFGPSLPAWTATATLLATPFFVAARRARRDGWCAGSGDAGR